MALGRAGRGLDGVMILAGAAAIDALFAEPPNAFHPVAAVGRMVGAAESVAPRGAAAQLVYGGLIAFTLPAAALALGIALERALQPLPAVLRIPASALALKPAFAVRALLDAATCVKDALDGNDLVVARRSAGSLVSRETGALDAHLLAAATIESVAENLTDSVVAPLLAFAAGGLPAAYWYRTVNTLDSMIGYRGRYEHLGKASARLDDLANLLPARVAALLLALAALAAGRSGAAALRGAWQGRDATASPNAGWTMGAMAAALDIQLEKRDHYVLNPSARRPTARDISKARRLVALAARGAFVLTAAALTARSLAVRR